MKRIITLALAGIMAAGMLASCGKFTCDSCGEEKSGKKYTKDFLGVKMTICKDCNDEFEAGMDALGALADLDF